ncbi:MAG: Maf family protein [Candidatus Peribacteraceae bacterium]|nr:Maf family protein [Candidatus Peribacteraceae bacterium]HCI04334.1 septum formation protein Maf [Candidatus Peribacteria bacterium]|tara:strand:- start:5533 stop:6102 length:570 start_codon:yes stop_codon:yes gene_type:complete
MLILASSSPQRQRLLKELGVEFEVIPSSINEAEVILEDPIERAKVLARLKAEDVSRNYSDAWVIGSDTLVVSSAGNLLEKPSDESHAREMLREQSGGVSQVHSAISLITPTSKKHEDVSTSHVHFRKLTDEDLDWWISTGLWEDRSGSFQIEGEGQRLVEKLEGDFNGVVGLPIDLLSKLFRDAGFIIP